MAETRKKGKPPVKAKRNPVAAGEPSPFPHLDPSYPVKPWVEPKTATMFATVTVRQENGQFVAIIAEHPDVRAVRKTQSEAEAAVKAAFISQLLAGRSNQATELIAGLQEAMSGNTKSISAIRKSLKEKK